MGISDRPIALVVHGYVLSQYALLWAAQVRAAAGGYNA
jgi:hypothetical protein